MGTIASVLGRFYVQTMMFGRNMIEIDGIDGNPPRDSGAWYLRLVSGK